MNCFLAFVLAAAFATSTCVCLILYVILRARYLKVKTNLKVANDSFAKQTKEMEALKKVKAQFADDFSASESTKSIIVAFNNRGVLTYVNDYAEEFFGYAKDEMLGKPVLGTIAVPPEKRDPNQPTLVEKILINPQLYVDVETKNMKKNGDIVWISWTNRVIYDEYNQPMEIRSVGFDITKRKNLEEKLKYLTSIDPLTGVLNRTAFLEIGAKEIKRASRYNRAVSLLILKLDHYRVLGQEHGYNFGDEALKKTVEICKNAIRESDYLGRIGDVEFAILLPETPLENVKYLEERLHLRIQEQNLKTEIGNAFITTAFGVAGRLAEKDSIDAMLVRANHSLKERQQKMK